MTSPSVGRRRALRAAAAAAFLPFLLAGCDSRASKLERIADDAPRVGRDATLAALAAGPESGMGWLNDAMLLASDRLNAGQDATIFAGAVLDLGARIEQRIPQQAVLLVIGLGALAYQAADAARARGDIALARSLVLGGPRRWQTDHYWLTTPHHDALVSIVLFEHGEREEAISRLLVRAEWDETRAELLRALQRAAGPQGVPKPAP